MFVVDVGSTATKAGFASEDSPRVKFCTVVGRGKQQAMALSKPNAYVGSEAQQKRAILSMRSPIQRGEITRWDDYEALLDHTFTNELSAPTAHQSIIMPTSVVASREDRTRLAQLLFEKYDFDRVNLSTTAALSLFAHGLTSGVVLDVGGGLGYTAVVNQGYATDVRTLSYAGNDLDDFMARMLVEKGCSLPSAAARDVARKVKETMCATSPAQVQLSSCGLNTGRSDDPRLSANPEPFLLPDSQSLSISSERFRCPEALFQPTMIGCPATDSCHNALWELVCHQDTDLRPQLLRNVVVAGGATAFPGFSQRLQAEMSALVYSDSRRGSTLGTAKRFTVAVHDMPNPEGSAWLGGSIMGTIGADPSSGMWMTRQNYEEGNLRVSRC